MDRRVRKTKERIMEAFYSISRKKALNKITVAELCDLADINRSTFYQHYADIFALFEEIEQDYVSKVKTKIDRLREDGDPQAVIQEILSFLTDNRLAILYFLKNRQYTRFFSLCQNLLENFYRERVYQNYMIPDSFSQDRLEFAFRFFSAGCYQTYLEWLEGKTDRTIAELSFYISDVSDTYFRTYFEKRTDANKPLQKIGEETE